ncbi:hypothetical protein SEMRO_92_G048010.1 [Seminavis robusta]|uniref:Uncharacterized protein n=1 Tax=Seminavis robusta TaxID=568900 RepID=A0A9N8H5Q1_9STRA|nr:hypothetical protein SEMRO_92_G048010.1 [Seminavis robusta]|eukprot:Sro92_g048010.1 n/a (147) ;mRNA; f:28963-29403
MSFSWRRLATTSGTEIGVEASSLWTVALVLAGRDVCSPSVGPVNLEQYAYTPLFRITVMNQARTRNIASICLPSDCTWILDQPRKVKSANSGLRAYRLKISVSSTKDGWDTVMITLPYDGENGSAVLFGQALAHAFDVVKESLRQA